MQILYNNDIDKSEWSRLVRTSATGNWFQTPEAYDFFASQKDIMEPFVYGLENEGKLRGICAGYITMEESTCKQFLTRRAIIVGGPALADDVSNYEVAALLIAIKTNLSFTRSFVQSFTHLPIYIETRNFNDYSKWRSAFEAAGFKYQPHLNFHVDTSSVEVVESNLGKSRKRDIKTSVRDGAFIIEQPTIEQVREYYTLLENLYRTKVKTPLFPLSFFEALYAHPDGRFLLVGLPGAEGKTEIIGGTVCVVFDKNKSAIINHKSEITTTPSGVVYEWFVCGRDGEWKSIFPSSVATYAGIKYAAEHGCGRFDMMGAGTPDEAYGVRDFKARFGGTEVEHGRFLCITKPLLYKIGVLGVKILKRLK